MYRYHKNMYLPDYVTYVEEYVDNPEDLDVQGAAEELRELLDGKALKQWNPMNLLTLL